MAEIQTAEDDDDEGFGDFTFAAAPVTNLKINGGSGGPDLSFNNNRKINGGDDADDDDWGDFVKSPTVSQSQSMEGKPFDDPFSFVTDPAPQTSTARVESKWVRPSGALPLSLFGEVEEEEGSGGAGLSQFNGAAELKTNKDAKQKRRSESNVTDLVSDLLKDSQQSQQSKNLNRSKLDSNGTGLNSENFSSLGMNLDLSGSVSDPNGLNSSLGGHFGWEFKGAESKSAAGDFTFKSDHQVNAGNGPASDSTVFNLSWNVLGSDSNGLSSKPSGVNVDANQSSLNFNGVAQDANGLSSNFKGVNLDANMLSSNINGVNVDANGSSLVGDNEDFGDDEWEFQDAAAHFGDRDSKVNSKEPENSVGNGVHDPTNLFVSSDGISQKSGEWEFGFDLNKSSVTQAIINNNSYSSTKQKNESENGLKSTGNSRHDLTNLFVASDRISQNSGDWNFGFDFNKSSVTDVINNNSYSSTKQKNDNETGLKTLGICAHDPTNSFVASDMISQKSGDWGFGFDFNNGSVTQDVFNNNSYSSSKQKNGNENGLNSTPVNGHVDDGEDIWEFKDAFSETGSNDNKFNDNENGLSSAPVNGHVDNGENVWGFKDAFSETGSKDKGNEAKFENHKGALPLSVFGDEELQTDNHLISQDVSTPTSFIRNEIKRSHSSTISINDLISSLYSQAEQNTSVNHTRSKSENALDSVNKAMDSNLVVGDGDIDDDSWEFKGALSGSTSIDETSVPNHGDSRVKYATKVEPKDHMDFYSILKHELCIVSQYHLDNLKKSRSIAGLCGKDAEVKALDEEIQDFYNELHQESIMSEEAQSENQPLNNCLNEFVEILHEPKFHVLEAEYHLSEKLSSAEKGWRSAIELLKHAASTSKILKLGSREDQSNYVSTWFKMVSVCAQELRHGALIWQQSLELNVNSQILSLLQGKRYILALGEIYRLVEVLGCSVKLYKPWVLSSSADPSGMFTLLSECSTLWSNSGIEEAFQNISDTAGSACNGTPKDLLESVKHIHDLDLLALHNHVLSGEEPTCRLSALTAGTVPGMKMVVWNGQHYFITLANFWANLISSDPPNWPGIHVG